MITITTLSSLMVAVLLVVPGSGDIVDHKDGDILIAYVDDYLNSKSNNRVQNALSFVAPVLDGSLWPQNATVGYVLWAADTDNMAAFMKMLKQYPKIVAIVGIRNKEAVFQLASFVTAIHLPVFTYAHGTIIDDALKYTGTEYVTRITAHATAQVVETIPNILHFLGVNVITVIYTADHYTQYNDLAKTLNIQEPRIEIIQSSLFNNSHPEDLYDNIKGSLVFKSDNTDRVSTFVFLTGRQDMISLMNLLQGWGTNNVIFVGDSSSCSIDFYNDSDLQTVAWKVSKVSMIRICQTFYPEKKITSYIRNFDPYSVTRDGTVKPFMSTFYHWYTRHFEKQCLNVNSECVAPLSIYQKDCLKEDKKCQSFGEFLTAGFNTFSKYNHRIYYSVLKILKALENMTGEQRDLVKSRSYEELFDPFEIDKSKLGELIYKGFQNNQIELPQNTTFLRYRNHVMDNDYEIIFNSYDSTKMSVNWQENNLNNFQTFIGQVKQHINSTYPNQILTCSMPCEAGWRSVKHERYINCWTCQRCSGNTISMGGAVAACTYCNSSLSNRLWANSKHTACNVAPSMVNISTKYGQTVFGVAVMNFLVLVLTVSMYIKHWKSKVIISSGRYLSICIFVGLVVGHTEAILIASSPESMKCQMIGVMAHLFMMLTVCPLLVRTFRIWFVFSFSVKLGKRTSIYTNNRAVSIQTIVLMVPQFLLILVDIFMHETYKLDLQIAEEMIGHRITATISCGSQNLTLMYISIAYSGALLLKASVLGYLCRKLPDNFKESMHIFISSMISLMLVVCYVPAMIMLAGSVQVFSLAMVITLISLALNIILFFPKIYAVTCMSEQEQKKRFNKSSLRSSTHKDSSV